MARLILSRAACCIVPLGCLVVRSRRSAGSVVVLHIRIVLQLHPLSEHCLPATPLPALGTAHTPAVKFNALRSLSASLSRPLWKTFSLFPRIFLGLYPVRLTGVRNPPCVLSFGLRCEARAKRRGQVSGPARPHRWPASIKRTWNLQWCV